MEGLLLNLDQQLQPGGWASFYFLNCLNPFFFSPHPFPSDNHQNSRTPNSQSTLVLIHTLYVSQWHPNDCALYMSCDFSWTVSLWRARKAYLNLYYHSLYNFFHSDVHGRLSGNIKLTGLNSPLENTSNCNGNRSSRVRISYSGPSNLNLGPLGSWVRKCFQFLGLRWGCITSPLWFQGWLTLL